MKHHVTALLLGCCLASVSLSSAFAGTPVSDSSKSVVIPATPQDDWYLTLAVYLWASSVSGDAGISGVTFPADMKFKDLIEELDFGYQGYFEVGKGRWSFGLDAIYAELSDDSTFAKGFVSGKASFEQEQAILTPRIQYRVIDDERCTLDVFVGGRWTYVKMELDIDANLGLGGFHLEESDDWFDPIIGFRSDIDLSNKWFLHLMGDIGGFGAASELTWQALAGFGYRFTPSTSGFIGYRALGVDYDRNDFLMDTITHGPIIGVAIKF